MVKKVKAQYLFFYILLFLGCFSFLGKENYLFLFASVITLFSVKKINILEFDFFAVFLLSVSSFFASLIFYDINEAIKSISFIMMYIAGKCYYDNSSDKSLFTKRVMSLIYVGSFAFVFLELIFNFNLHNSDTTSRTLINVWTKTNISVTLVATISSIILSYSIAKLFFAKKKLWAFVFLIVTLFLNIKTATRTPFVLCVILIVVCLFAKYRGKPKSEKPKYLLVCIIMIIAVSAGIAFNAFGIRDYIVNTDLYERFAGNSNSESRIRISVMHFKYMLSSVWGGGKIHEITGYYGHNWIQDGYDLYGILALISTCFLTVSIFISVLKMIKMKNRNENDTILMILVFGTTVALLVEPVFSGYPSFICTVLFLKGIMNSMLKDLSGSCNENSLTCENRGTSS